MICSRCGSDAVVKRDSAFYCGKCAVARDWEEIIILVQETRVDPLASAVSEVVAEAKASAVLEPVAPEPVAPEPVQVPQPVEPAVIDIPVGAGTGHPGADSPADPFAR